MPGNEIADKVHNFFGQDNLSQCENQSQVISGNWPVLNNDLWVGNQRQIGTSPTSNTKNYNAQQSEFERGNSRQSSQMPLSTNITQSTLRPEFAKNQSRNQQQSLNGFMHRLHGFQVFGDNSVSDQHNLTSRGLSGLESQRGNAHPAMTSSSERLEIAEAPINFDFLGGQQQLMRGHQPGMPQPQPRQQSGFNDMQLWQQQQMFKQLQELQRQQQLQQLDEARQQNSMNQLSAMAKQAGGDQLPALINGTPVHNMSNYLWSSELPGNESKVPSTSQMYMIGNTNWVQQGGSSGVQGFPNGVVLSHEQGQPLRSMGLVTQQLDQSLYGAPVASTRGTLGQYPHLQGISHDPVDMLTRAGGNQVEKPIAQSSAFGNSFQSDQCAVFPEQVLQDDTLISKSGFQGKNMFAHVPVQGLTSGVLSGNLQQVNSLTMNAPLQDFHGRQEQADWSGNLQEKAAMQAGSSQGLVTLDPTEEKILFNTDDGIWDSALGRSINMGIGGFGNPLEGQDYLNGFPSIQSGSWSALMQSAVAEASSSDTGLHDEWSGLSFQKTELSMENQPGTFNDSGKQQASWVDNNLQSVSSLTSRPFLLFDDANMNPSCPSIPGFQQAGIKFSREQSDRLRPDSSHESIQQSPKEGSGWLERSPQQKPLVEGRQQVQQPMHLENASEGAWAGQIYDNSVNAAHSEEPDLSAQNMQGSWAHQQSVSSYNSGNQPCNKPNGWNINESLSPSGDAALRTRENENTLQHSQNNDYKRSTHTEMDHDGGMWRTDGNHLAISFSNATGGLEQIKSATSSPHVNREVPHMNNFAAMGISSTAKTTQEPNQLVPNSHHLDYGKHAVESSAGFRGNEVVGYQHQPSKGPQGLESSMNNTERGTSETYSNRQERYYQNEISSGNHNSNQPHHTVTGGMRGNAWSSTNDSRPSAGGNQKSSAQVDRKSSGPRRFQYHPMGNLGVNVEPADTMKHFTHSQALSQQVARGLKSHEQGYFGHSNFVAHVPNNAMDMEKGHLPDFQGNTKGSEEVPSKGVNVSASFDGSAGFYAPNRTAQTGQNMLELLHKVDQSRESNTITHFGTSEHNSSSEMPGEAFDASVAHLQQNQPSQGFGLRLAPPSQRLPVSNHSFTQRSLQTVNDLNSMHVEAEIGEKGQTELVPTASVQSLPHEMSQKEQWDNKSSISGQRGNANSHLNMQANSSAALTSSLPYPRNQHMSSASGQVRDQSVNNSFDRIASRFRQTNDSHDGADNSALASLPGAASRIPPFNVASRADTSQPISSSSSYPRVSGQHPVLEAVPISQPSVSSGIPQQGAFSTMLHNVWTNVSTQHRLSGGHNVPPNLFQSINSSNNKQATTSWAPQKPDVQDLKKRGNEGPSEPHMCSINSQRFTYGEETPEKERTCQLISSEMVNPVQQMPTASLGQESMVRYHSDGNSISSGSLMARSHQQLDFEKGRLGKDSTLVSQMEHASLQNPAASNKDTEIFGHSLKPSHVFHHNYSLLHQVQAMKNAETDPSKRGVKRLKGADCGPDAQQVASKVGQQSLYGYGTMVRDTVDNELNAAVRHTSFPSGDAKMLNFSSEAREDRNVNASSQPVLGNVPSQDMVTFCRNDSQNRSINTGIATVRAEHAQISPLMAPSWFEQYGTFKNGQMLPMYDPRKDTKTAAQQFLFGKSSESFHPHTSLEQAKAPDASQVGSVLQSTTTTLVASEHLSLPHPLPPDVTDQSLGSGRPKKRKNATFELLPWHSEVTQGSRRPLSISMAEVEWAQSANRLIEKVEDEAEMTEDGQPMLRPRRRLIFTTQLMQQLLRPPPPAILSVNAISDYESATYFVAKLALGDACGLISCSGSGLRVPSDNGNMPSEKFKASERIGDQYFSKVVEDFIGRARKLENDLIRWDKRSSILDIRVECQEQERYAIVNRFVRFLGRNQADGAESSVAAATAQKTCPQKYITPIAMPRNLPEGVHCLSL